MSNRKYSWIARALDLMSRGSVPIDGGYFVESQAPRLTVVPRGERSRIPSLSAQPLKRQHCV